MVRKFEIINENMYYADCTCIGNVDLKKSAVKKMRIKNIDHRNWSEWSPFVIRTMRNVFPRDLWWTPKNFIDTLNQEEYIARLATIEGKFAGFSLGLYDKVPERALGAVSKRTRVIHLYYVFLDTPYLHRGYGYQLIKDFVDKARARKYRKLTVFAKRGPSVKNLQKLGARKLKVFDDFYDTGETYIFCAMDLAY